MKKFIPYIVSGIVAVGAFFYGAVTDIGGALQIAFDKEKAIATCTKLIEGEQENTGE